MGNQILSLSKEAYVIDMVRKYFNGEVFDASIPEHQKFADHYFDLLLNNKDVIDFDSDLVFIKQSYKSAKLQFGDMVYNHKQTKRILADILAERYNVEMFDYDDILEEINIDTNFKTKQDIEDWIIDQEQLIKNIKISNCGETVGTYK